MTWSYSNTSLNVVQLGILRSGCKSGHVAMARKKASVGSVEEEPSENELVVKKKATRSPKTKKATVKTKKKTVAESSEGETDLLVNEDDALVEESSSLSSDDSKKKVRKTRKKDASISAGLEEKKELKGLKKVTRRRKPKEDNVILEDNEAEINDQDEPSFIENVEDEGDDGLELVKDDGEDISYTYGWPPLVCCFGAAQHCFVPSGRPANRLIDHELHERMKDALWSPEKFVRAPGSSAGSVAIALASLGGKVAFMGKLADDEYGQAMLYYMNANNVQTRSVSIDSKRATGASLMKIGKRKLKMSCVKPCAEDCLTKAEINIDVLKEVRNLKPFKEKDLK